MPAIIDNVGVAHAQMKDEMESLRMFQLHLKFFIFMVDRGRLPNYTSDFLVVNALTVVNRFNSTATMAPAASGDP